MYVLSVNSAVCFVLLLLYYCFNVLIYFNLFHVTFTWHRKNLFVYFVQTQFCALFHKCKYWFTDGWQIKGKPGGSFMLWRSFCLHGLGPLVPLEGNVIANQYEVLLIDHLYSEIKHFCLDGSGLFPDVPTPIHSSHRLTQ